MSEATGMDGLRKKLGIIVGPDKAEYDRYDDPSAVSQELVDSVFRAIADAGFVLINMRDADLSQDMEPDLMSQDLMSEKELAERTKAIEMPEGTRVRDEDGNTGAVRNYGSSHPYSAPGYVLVRLDKPIYGQRDYFYSAGSIQEINDE